MRVGLLWSAAIAFLLVGTLAERSAAQHNVPSNTQDTSSDCGPAAAAACLGWFKANGWPNLVDADGNSGLKDFENQLETDAGTDDKGTWAHKLRDAMNKLVDGTPYKGQLRAKLPKSSSAYKDFTFLDEEFSHNEDILLMLRWKHSDGNLIDHYVAVKNVTGSGSSRTVSYMDPANGATKSGTATIGGDGRLHLSHDGTDAEIAGILTMSPANTTATTTNPVDPANPSAGTQLHYTVYYPSFRPTRDTHVWVSDCDKTHYAVSGLPAGWSWDVKKTGRRCYLSFWKGASANEIANGATVTVTYTGPKSVRSGRRSVMPTTGGTASPAVDTQAPGPGHTVMAPTPILPPDRPDTLVLAPSFVDADGIDIELAWSPVPDPNVAGYEVYDANSGELVGETSGTSMALAGLEADVSHEFVVVANNYDAAQMSEDSEPVAVYLDSAGALAVPAGAPQQLKYVPPLYSGDEPAQWLIDVPAVPTSGNLHVLTFRGQPIPELIAPVGNLLEHYYGLWWDATPDPGPISLAVPYDVLEVSGDVLGLQLWALVGSTWQDVTIGVDPVSGRVFGQIPEPTLIALVDAAAPVPAVSTWGAAWMIALLVVTGSLLLFPLRRRPQSGPA